MDERSAAKLLTSDDHCTCGARCGESVCWDLEDAIACTVDRILHPGETEGVHRIPIPDDPEIIAHLFAQMRSTCIAECGGSA
jgi:hypothetical protein